MLGQLPYSLIYLNSLRSHSHYDFFPIVLVCFGCFIATRWTGGVLEGVWRTRSSFTCLGCSIFLCLLALAFSSAWIAFLGWIFAWIGLLVLLQEKQTGKSLLYLWILLVVVWQPPYSSLVTGDIVLTSRLQRLSARLVGNALDGWGIPHANLGTIISIRGRDLGSKKLVVEYNRSSFISLLRRCLLRFVAEVLCIPGY